MNKNYNYKKLTPFKWFVLQNFPFIDEDFDAITNYQLFCKLGEEINKLIISMNQAGTQVEELTNYVNNYFDNLDVQQEINNKLDQMTESGELQQIISSFLQINSIITFENVENMKNSVNLLNGSVAFTKGFYNSNDGGSSYYIINQDSNYNDIDSFKLNNLDLYAHLLKFDKINVKQLGLNSELEDNSSIIQYAINNWKDIYIPSGDYKINNTIKCNKNYQTFNCLGTIFFSNIIAFEIECYHSNFIFNDLRSINSKEGTAILLSGKEISCSHNNIQIQHIVNSEYGILMQPNNKNGIVYNNINFNLIHANYCIALISGDNSSNWINENIFNGGQLMGKYGIFSKKGLNQIDTYNGNKFNHIGFEGLETAIILEFAKNNDFLNCRMSESISDYYIILNEGTSLNKFYINSTISLNNILDNSNDRKGNYFEASMISNIAGTYLAHKLRLIQGCAFLIESESYWNNYINIYNKSYEVPDRNLDIFAQNLMFFNWGADGTGDYTLKLNKAFGKYGCNKFIVNIVFKGGNPSATFNILDYEGNVIISNDNFNSNQRYLCMYAYNNDIKNFEWIAKKL